MVWLVVGVLGWREGLASYSCLLDVAEEEVGNEQFEKYYEDV
jgi:hypothetical protein